MRFSVIVNGEPIIPAYWQSLWSAMYNVATMLGSVSAGFLQDRLGRRSVFLASATIAAAGIALTFVAGTPAEFLGGKIVSGYAMGFILAGTQTWVSEIAPLPMRGIALSTNTIMLVSVSLRIEAWVVGLMRGRTLASCSPSRPPLVACR